MDKISQIEFDPKHIVFPNKINEIKFHGSLEEFKKYLPELYEKMQKEPKT